MKQFINRFSLLRSFRFFPLNLSRFFIIKQMSFPVITYRILLITLTYAFYIFYYYYSLFIIIESG